MRPVINKITVQLVATISFGYLVLPAVTYAEKGPVSVDAYVGAWMLQFEDGYGGWLRVERDEAGGLTTRLMWRVGSERGMRDVEATEQGLRFYDQRKPRGKPDSKRRIVPYLATIDGDSHELIRVVQFSADNKPKSESSSVAFGRKAPEMPKQPSLKDVEWGERVELFNGRDLTGWKLQPADAKNGWSVRDGVLVNQTPKTDFSAYGSYGNLRTESEFKDQRLHIEFNVERNCNSGVYVRGLYEAQVVDRDSRMQGISGVGAIFGRIAPSENAGFEGGSWQSYDIMLVDRHITVVLNGKLVIDNEPVNGCTGGCLIGDVTAAGPLYLQGDHTSVKYRNIWIQPRTR